MFSNTGIFGYNFCSMVYCDFSVLSLCLATVIRIRYNLVYIIPS